MTPGQGTPVGDAGAPRVSKRLASLIAAAVLVLWLAFFALPGPLVGVGLGMLLELLAPIVILVVTLVVNVALDRAGAGVELEGP